MRISDWSSDVCSSDLQYVLLHQGAYVGPWWRVATQAGEKNALHAIRQPEIAILFQVQEDHATVNLAVRHIVAQLVRHGVFLEAKDRKSVVSGKSVSVRVDLGGRRISKKKK